MILFPNAKINLGLNVVAKRADGYHNLETVFYPIPIKDALEVLVSPNQSDSVYYSSSGIIVDGPVEKNLCVKAYNLLKLDFDLAPVKIHLHKTIPMGGGLGGGSADAAFMLVAINNLMKLSLSDDELIKYAARLGADCAFFIKNSPCYATGIGEILTPIDLSLAGCYLVLLNPNIHVSTAEAFSNIKPTKPIRSVLDVVREPRHIWPHNLHNDFEGSVFPVHPEIQRLKEALYADGAFYCSMSGSGSSVYALFDCKPSIISHSDFLVWEGFLE